MIQRTKAQRLLLYTGLASAGSSSARMGPDFSDVRLRRVAQSGQESLQRFSPEFFKMKTFASRRRPGRLATQTYTLNVSALKTALGI